VRKALRGERIPLFGNGCQVRDWIHVQDHVEALLLVATAGEPGETYCIGADCERSNRDFVLAICAEVDKFRSETETEQLDLAAAAGESGEGGGAAAGAFAMGGRVRRSADLVQSVADRPGHDRRYGVDATKLRRYIRIPGG